MKKLMLTLILLLLVGFGTTPVLADPGTPPIDEAKSVKPIYK